ncbi:hypothetical protein HS088_TW19G00046 [Tripterygium wilfordii]|uniref:Uncharacterized protein n=1 Tax=Tripterygium wilfordii TaxID=458696 RepID=A0A7J7C9C2_TRIWF|nr:hypothetical protein HS088_TW19G00046 [Tripterygium wilfordii]
MQSYLLTIECYRITYNWNLILFSGCFCSVVFFQFYCSYLVAFIIKVIIVSYDVLCILLFHGWQDCIVEKFWYILACNISSKVDTHLLMLSAVPWKKILFSPPIPFTIGLYSLFIF